MPQAPGATPEIGRGLRGGPQAVSRSIRVGIYVRVSTDEQASLEYNSLQAQEEICRTYISMRGGDPAAKERWTHTATYSDPGASGGTLERPGLRHLLHDVEARKLDAIVTYKLDRFSRSISQFYQVWTILERRGVNLVSVTQDLNTATAQGRLVLNVLLAFAQHERELTSERTRDKVHAARKKGKWTGGHPPLGLDLDPNRGRLVVNPDEADLVRAIFRLYLERLSLTQTVEELDRRCWTRKRWITKQGREYGGQPFDAVTLHRLLTNPVYVGKVKLKGRVFDGEHEPIVDEATWGLVQARLHRNGSTGGKDTRNRHHALLRGIVRCGHCGSAMTHSFTTKKNGVRYRYYRCVNNGKRGSFACPGGSVAAHKIEQLVVDHIRRIARDPELAAETLRQARKQLDERVRALDAERRLLGKQLQRARAGLTRLAGRRRSNGDETGLADCLAELEDRIRASARRLADVDTHLAAARLKEIGDDEVGTALEAFGPVWDALFPAERARTLRFLVERVEYGGREGTLVIRARRTWMMGLVQKVGADP